MPIVSVPRLLASVLSLAILALAAWFLWDWWHGDWTVLPDGIHRRVHGAPWALAAGLALLAWSFLGRSVVMLLLPGERDAAPAHRGEPGEVAAPNGAKLRTDSFGAAGAPTLVLTHGWGLNGTVWGKTVQVLGDRFRLVTWDLPGIGRSTRPTGDRYAIDDFARALAAVVAATEAPRVVLVGHSIGGMTTETVWRACPLALRSRVAGLVLVDTTYLDPLKTMIGAGLWTALQKPLIEPINRLAVVLSPLLWLSAWQGYLSGSSHIVMRLTGFGRFATRETVDLTARLACKSSPAVQAKGNLAMLNWSAEAVLPTIDVPVLILTGTHDIVTLPEASRTMARAIPDARLIAVEGAGHMGFLERAQAYNQAIGEFAEAAFARAPRGEGEAAELRAPMAAAEVGVEQTTPS